MFSSHVGVDQSVFLNDDDNVYDTIAKVDARHPVMKQVRILSLLALPPSSNLVFQFVGLNNQIIDFAESKDVRAYIVAPPMVCECTNLAANPKCDSNYTTDGPGRGFGNKISIQNVALVRVARALGQLYQVDKTDTVSAN